MGSNIQDAQDSYPLHRLSFNLFINFQFRSRPVILLLMGIKILFFKTSIASVPFQFQTTYTSIVGGRMSPKKMD